MPRTPEEKAEDDKRVQICDNFADAIEKQFGPCTITVFISKDGEDETHIVAGHDLRFLAYHLNQLQDARTEPVRETTYLRDRDGIEGN